MVAISVRYSTDPQLSHTGAREQYASEARQIIVLETLDRSSLEGLQALIILAIHTIGIGQGPRSWSIVGMATRLASQLGISVDNNTTGPQPSTLQVKLLPQPTTWTEAEERRRTFWAAFILDRFSSFGTGWNTTYNILDIDLKLPCDDKYWDYSQQVDVPKFSKVDKSKSSLSEFPNLLFPDSTPESFTLGSFSYLVESVECLSRVHTFFLQRTIAPNSPNEVQNWVSRCRLLDTMLMQWRERLPERFKFSAELREPNLILMWATYNAAVVLLHQSIAYSRHKFSSKIPPLPEAFCAKRCIEATAQVSLLIQSLRDSDLVDIHPHFCFCLFVLARALLAHEVIFDTDLKSEVSLYIITLLRIAKYWTLATRFATILQRVITEQGTSISHVDTDLNATKRDRLLDVRKAAYDSSDGEEANADDNEEAANEPGQRLPDVFPSRTTTDDPFAAWNEALAVQMDGDAQAQVLPSPVNLTTAVEDFQLLEGDAQELGTTDQFFTQLHEAFFGIS